MAGNRSDVYLRGTVYWCWIKCSDGVWRRKSTGRRDKVAAKLEKKRLERQHSDPDHYAAHQTTVATAVKNLIAFKKNQGKAEGTIEMYDQKGGHLTRVFGEDCRLIDVTASRVDRYIATRLGETASRHTIHKELVTLRGALKVAKRRGEFPGDIFGVMPVGFSQGYVPRKTYLKWEQIDLLLGELHPRRAAHVAYIIATGGRRVEGVRAKRAHSTGDFVHLPGTKTSKSERTIPVVEKFRALLDRALRDAPDKKGVLFEPWQNARRDILRACKRLRDKKHDMPDVTWNDLRRTFASLLRQEGVQLDLLADLLGHSNTKMVREVYGQDTPQRMANELARQIGYGTITTQASTETAASPAKNEPEESI